MKLNKPRFWDKTEFSIWPYFFLTLSVIINLFNILKFKFIKSKKFNIPIITVGNIYLGGTGKTPLCIEIFNILSSFNGNPGFVKKYYEKYEDENNLLKKKGNTFLDKKRSEAIQKLINNRNKIAILDDGLHDPSIKSDISIVCFSEKNWIGNGFIIPSGPLREKLSGLKRCTHMFIKGNRNERIETVAKKYNQNIEIFYTKYKAKNLEKISNKKIIAFTGIGNPDNFFKLLKDNNLEIIKTINFPDHYNFSKKDILKLKEDSEKLKAILLTTEKDYMRLSDDNKKHIDYLEIELIIDKKDKFINEIKKIHETF